MNTNENETASSIQVNIVEYLHSSDAIGPGSFQRIEYCNRNQSVYRSSYQYIIFVSL